MLCTKLQPRFHFLWVVVSLGLVIVVSPAGCSRSQEIENNQPGKPLAARTSTEPLDEQAESSRPDQNRGRAVPQEDDREADGHSNPRQNEVQVSENEERQNNRKTTSQPGVTIIRTPENGIQPQVVVDADGVVHLIYYKGDSASGDLFYVHKEPMVETFSRPIQINSQSGSAIAVGTIRGCQMAVGQNGRVHVAWNGNSKARPRGPLNPELPKDNPYNGTPMLYSRLNNTGTAFEPQRNLMQTTFALDGGGTVAADDDGNVYVAWHGRHPDSTKGEQGRRVWIAVSTNDGKSFAAETSAWDNDTGACGCCGMRAFADSRGTVYALYRSATQSVNRDMYLIVSNDRAKTFRGNRIDRWEIDSCPMSSAYLTEVSSGLIAAWETREQVYFAKVDPERFDGLQPIAAPARGKNRKHPVIAGNASGEIILVWTEGTGWKRGGSVAWQVFDRDLRPTGVKGSARGVPVWSFVAVFARQDGGFSIIY